MDWRKYFFIEVTNRGNYPRFIHKPGFKSDLKEPGNYISLIDIHEQKKYPYPLSPGEVYTYFFDVDHLGEAKEKGATKIRISVNDTNGKRYYSPWIKI